jgi:hypothetical protein
MNSAQLVSLAMGLLPGFMIVTLIYTVTIRMLERRLTFTQSLMISAVACAISIALMVVYYLAKAQFSWDKIFDGIMTLVAWSVLAIIITRLAHNYGIEKKGWFGLGGRANLWLLGLSWVVICIVL